ncbi:MULTISPECIES: CoA transferase [Streptacidiphilus]|uniref:CoA transferase n=1 Tax=Streptacidiphilus cavernicola TaxID=3342716 RepID=A0ABV6UMF8_9ACTN|nr:CoA transferase [Streptacidiphilus jeojiense]
MVTGSSGSSPAEVARHWARSGVMALTGHRGAAPVLPVGDAAGWAARMSDRIAEATRQTRRPVLVDGARLLAERAAFTGHTRQGRTSPGGSCRLLPTADGWAAVSCARPDDPSLLGALIGHEADERLPERLADWLSGHTGAELDERSALLGLAAGAVRQQRPAGDPDAVAPPGPFRPVQDLLVVDFSALWAGPLCAHLLGLAGAQVVKVEVPTRPDGARLGNPDFYRLLHAGHRSVALDPADRDERRALHALVRRADIVIEASRPRALARFGLDAAAEVERGCTWVSITAYGRSSPRVGFGDDVAAANGLLGFDAQGLPVFCGDAIADPLTGLAAAVLALTEPEGGHGVLREVAMADVVAATLRKPEGDIGTAAEHLPLARPTARTPAGPVPAMGADTAEVLGRLGIGVP